MATFGTILFETPTQMKGGNELKELMSEEEKYESHKRSVKKYTESMDRINLLLPKGTKERIMNLGFSASEFIRQATLEELERAERYIK